MKEMIKQKMMKRLHRHNSSSSSTSSIDNKSGEKFDFSFSSLQVLQVPKGWDKLSLSLISVETGKTISKTGKASVWNGNCRWTETLSESVWISHDDASKELEQCLYKLLVSMGSGRSGILGESTVNLSDHLSSETSVPTALQLKKCNHETILQVQIQCLNPKVRLRSDRWRDTDSFAEDANADYDDLDNSSDVSGSRITKSIGSSTSNNFPEMTNAGGHGSWETSLSAGGSHHSFDSMEDSFGRESCSPGSNLSDVVNDLIGGQDSSGSRNTALYSSYHAYDSPRSSHSPYISGPGKHIQNQRLDSGKLSHSIPASPLRSSGSSEFVLEAEGATVEELRAEARMWERNARKLMLDLDVSRKESKDQMKNLENVTMELSSLQTECDGLKQEIKHLKVLLSESAAKEEAADSLRLQVQDKNDIQTELEEELKFQKELNDNLALQLNKTQESNLELVSVLQELEEIIEKQRLEIKSLSELKVQVDDAGLKLNCEPDGEEIDTRKQVSARKMKGSCDSDHEDSSIENSKSGLFGKLEDNDQSKLELQLQQYLESQKRLESTILYLEKTLNEKSQEIELERDLKTRTMLESDSEWREKLSSKDKEIFDLESKLSEALSAQVPKKTESQATENVMEEIKALKDKVQELERDCNELTDENLELLFKLKESSKDLSTSGTSINSSDGRPSTGSPATDDSELSKLERQIWQLKEEAKKRELDGMAAGYLQVRCNDLESKCAELEIQRQDFEDRACFLDDELKKYRAKAEERENEIVSLNQLLKCQHEEKHENSFTQVQIFVDNEVQLDKSSKNFCVPEDTVQCGEEETKVMIKDPYIVENEMENGMKAKSYELEKLNMELKSRVEDLDKELLAKTSEIEVLRSDCLQKEEEIQSQRCYQQNLEAQLSDLHIAKSQSEESLESMQTEGKIASECLNKARSDMEVLNSTKDSYISANKTLERKLLEVESCNHELELHVAELEQENLHSAERISGLESQLRYLTDVREASRLDVQHSETHVANLQAEIGRLENELETSKVDMRQKLQDMQKRWLESQEECEYLKKANPKLQANAENLIEECNSLQRSNGELRQQRQELHSRCTVLEAELRESQNNFSKLSHNLEILEQKFSSMLDEIASKEKLFDSELDALRLQTEEHTEKLATGESLLNQMYMEKAVEVEKLQQEVAHLSAQISATHDERDRMASEAVLEMHVLRADKDNLEKAIEDVQGQFRSSEKKLDAIKVEYETKILDLTGELATSKQNHEVLVANHEKLMELLENTRSNEDKLKSAAADLDANLKSCEYQRLQLTEEISSLKVQLQKMQLLQDEVVALKNSLNDVKFENERLEASLQLISGDYEELKEEKSSLFQKTCSMEKAMIELEEHRRSKVVLEEKLLRLQGDLTAREALSAQDAELKNELGRMKRSNSQLQWKVNLLQEEKDECMKKAQALEEKIEQKKDLEPDENIRTENNMALSSGSHCTSSLHEDMKPSEDKEASTTEIAVNMGSRIQSLENELAEALEANDMYKAQLKSFLSEGKVHHSDVPVKPEVDEKAIDNEEHKHKAALLESELRELQERYLHMSLKYAEVEAQRSELVLKLKTASSRKFREINS